MSAPRRMRAGERTEGHRQLVQVLQRISQAALARRVGVSVDAVSLWVRLRGRPDIDSAIALEDDVGIAARAWTHPPLVEIRRPLGVRDTKIITNEEKGDAQTTSENGTDNVDAGDEDGTEGG